MEISYYVINLFTLFHLNYLCVAYQNYTLQGYDLCVGGLKPFKTVKEVVSGPPTINLDSGKKSSVIITQTWNSTNYSKVKSICKFRIISLIPNSGIYIVITKLNFRKNLVTNTCIDYIEFSRKKSQHNIINRTCDKFGLYDNETRLLFNKSDNDDNEIFITVSVNKSIKIEETLELNIVATSYYDCGDNLFSSKLNFQCDSTDRYSCISHFFVNDGIKNCLPPCVDEVNCSLKPVNKYEVVDVSHVALSAITSLIFTMVGVGFCLWIYWKYRDCANLNQQDNNSSRNINNDRQRRQSEITANVSNQENLGENNRRNQTILIETQSPLESPKEDLPPSYESLFPER